jgi:alpha-tubulin suppressor-like RCC1 family protein
VAVAAGQSHALALRSDGVVGAWGANESGQLGDGATTERRTPTATLLTGGIVAIAAGGPTSLAVRSDGAVLSWGGNFYGQLGTGSKLPTQRSTPTPVAGVANAVAVALGTGRGHALALLADGTLHAWGNNDAGQLGDGTMAERLTPVVVTGLDLH